MSVLSSAFSRLENHSRLNHYFTLLLQRTLLQRELLKHGAKQTHYIEPFLAVLPAVRALTLPEETKVKHPVVCSKDKSILGGGATIGIELR